MLIQLLYLYSITRWFRMYSNIHMYFVCVRLNLHFHRCTACLKLRSNQTYFLFLSRTCSNFTPSFRCYVYFYNYWAKRFLWYRVEVQYLICVYANEISCLISDKCKLWTPREDKFYYCYLHDRIEFFFHLRNIQT